MSKELTVILKDEARSYREKFLVYEDFCLQPEDPMINMCIEKAKKNFDGEPEYIQVRVLMVVR